MNRCKYLLIHGICALAVSFAPSAYAGKLQGSKVLTLYGVEILRRPDISIEEFEDFAKMNPQADSLLWKYPGLQYKGAGVAVLAGYFLDRSEAEFRKKSIGAGAKILDISADPFFATGKRSVYLYRIPRAGDDDSVRGDVWVRSEGRDRLMEKDVLLGYYDSANTTVFKAQGLSKDGQELLYCRGECFRYNLKSDRKTKREQ